MDLRLRGCTAEGVGEERGGEWFCRAIARTFADATPGVNRISLYECRRGGDKTCRLLLVIGDISAIS